MIITKKKKLNLHDLSSCEERSCAVREPSGNIKLKYLDLIDPRTSVILIDREIIRYVFATFGLPFGNQWVGVIANLEGNFM